nr:hypothetical protein [Tanacetum cinerariifolium]
CLIPNEDIPSQYESDSRSRFPAGLYQTNNKGFKTHVKTHFLSPLITYTVNLVFDSSSYDEQAYVDLKYRLRGETTFTVSLAKNTDRCLYMAELYQFTSDGSIFDLEIMFEDCETNIRVEGILFQPLEIVDPLLKDDKSDSGILMKNLFSSIGKWFLFNNDTTENDTVQEWASFEEKEKKCVMLSARVVCFTTEGHFTWRFLSGLRFGEVLVITAGDKFELVNEIKPEALSNYTTYASYFVYKLPSEQSKFESPLEVCYKSDEYYFQYTYSYLVTPPNTPVIGQKFDENYYNPLNRHRLSSLPRQRSDGWMEVKVWEFDTRSTPTTVSMHLKLEHPVKKDLSGLIILGIELRPTHKMSAMANTTPIVTTVTKPATNPGRENTLRDADATTKTLGKVPGKEEQEKVLTTQVLEPCPQGRAHLTDLAKLTRQAQSSPDRTGQALGIVLSIEAVLTSETLLMKIVLRVETAVTASRNHMTTLIPHMGPTTDIAIVTETAPTV